jgi:hypothetical protein
VRLQIGEFALEDLLADVGSSFVFDVEAEDC